MGSHRKIIRSKRMNFTYKEIRLHSPASKLDIPPSTLTLKHHNQQKCQHVLMIIIIIIIIVVVIIVIAKKKIKISTSKGDKNKDQGKTRTLKSMTTLETLLCFQCCVENVLLRVITCFPNTLIVLLDCVSFLHCMTHYS